MTKTVKKKFSLFYNYFLIQKLLSAYVWLQSNNLIK